MTSKISSFPGPSILNLTLVPSPHPNPFTRSDGMVTLYELPTFASVLVGNSDVMYIQIVITIMYFLLEISYIHN